MSRSKFTTRKSILPLLTLFLVPAAALASGEHSGDHDGSEAYTFGEPASPSSADRTITIEASDRMTFSPSDIVTSKGETIRFVVRNVGELPHSFTLGTPTDQRMHEDEMQGMSVDKVTGHMADDATGMTVPAGNTDSLTWRFTDAGAVQFACHVPGHYPKGMKGTIRVKP